MKLNKEILDDMYNNCIQMIQDYREGKDSEKVLRKVMYNIGMLTTAMIMASEKEYSGKGEELKTKAGKILDSIDKL